MTYSTAALENEYSDASVDDILAEYQYEQHNAAVEARYEAIMREEPQESSPETVTDNEGVKVYTPKKALSETNPFAVGFNESSSPAPPAGNEYIQDFDVPLRADGRNEYIQELQTEEDEGMAAEDYSEYSFDSDAQAYEEDTNPYIGSSEAEYSDLYSGGYYSDNEASRYSEQYAEYSPADELYSEEGGAAYTQQYAEEAAEYQDAGLYTGEAYKREYPEEAYQYDYPQEGPEEAYAETGYAEDTYGDDTYTEDYTESAYPEEEYPAGDSGTAFLTAEDFDENNDVEIDPRFNLSGERKSVLLYNGRELDISPEENYIPPSSSYSMPVQEDRDIYEEEPQPEEKRKKRFGFGRKKKSPLNAPPADDYSEQLPENEAEPESEELNAASAEADFGEQPPQVQEFSDNADEGGVPLSQYAEKDDYSGESSFEAEDESFDTAGDYAEDEELKGRKRSLAAKHRGSDEFPSFGQYILEYITGIIYSFKHSVEPDGSTMEDSDEDLGRELSPMKASKYYGSYVHSMRLRLRIALVILLIMGYISLGFPVTGMLKTLPVQAAVLMGSQLCIMLLCLDIITGAVMNIFRGRFGADSLAVILCILTTVDALTVIFGAIGEAHTPFCLLSSLSLVAVLLSSLLSARGLRKALRVPAIGKTVYTVTGDSGVKGSGMTLLKSVRSSSGFVRRTEEASPDETFFNKISPILFIVCILLAVAVAAIKKSWSNYLFILTAFMAPAVPLTALLCFALPFFVGSMRIFASGASIAGWSGLCDIGASKNLVVTDRDLFPQGSVEIENILILDDMPSEKVISYIGTMLSASGSGISSCFIKLMEKNGCPMKKVQNFEYLAGGGFKGIIDGDTVLCGGVELMRLMNVHVPYRQIKSSPVLLAVNGMLYGVFNMKYTAQPQVRKALISLIKSNRHPIFAVRDFNINPEMLRECFDVATDGYDFPPFIERFSISEAKPSESSKISAVVCREGLGPLTHMADTGRSMYVATRINIFVTLLSVIIGILAVFIKFVGAGAASSGFLLVYMLIWSLPVTAASFTLKF